MAIKQQELQRARPKSVHCYQQLCQTLPGGVNSPVRAFKQMEIPPLVAMRGAADLIYDLDEHAYIDYCGSWGALIHGHAHPEIVAQAYAQMQQGSTFGVTTQIEGELALQIQRHLPSMQKMRFVSSGTEAAMSAARLARGCTGRDWIVKFNGNYHGHADFFLIQAGSGVLGLNSSSSSGGIPAEIVRNTVSLPYNQLDICQKFLSDPAHSKRIAAVIIEPIAGNIGCVPADPEFLQMLRSLTREIGALLIFDEVITGFRVDLGGAQGLYGITPDLTCLGKIIGGGFPAAAFGGRADLMEQLAPLGPVYQAGTLSGNPVAMAAGLAALKLLEKDSAHARLLHKTKLLTVPIKAFIEEKGLNMCVQQAGSMFTLFFGRRQVRSMEEAKQLDAQAFAHFFRTLFARGVYFPPLQQETAFVSLAHTEAHLEYTREMILDYLSTLKLP
jgi:glutamate-1-semialdehyde 2,1-aminomutase